MSLLTVSLFAVLLTFPYAMQLVFNTRRSTALSSTTQPCPKTRAGWPSEPRGMQPQPVLQCATWTRSAPCSQMLVDFSSAGAGRHIRPSCSGMQLWTQRAMQAQPSRWLCVQPPRRLEGRKHRIFGSASTWSDQSFYRGTKGKLRPVGSGQHELVEKAHACNRSCRRDASSYNHHLHLHHRPLLRHLPFRRHNNCHYPHPRYQAMKRSCRSSSDQTTPCGYTFDECQ